jgi:hypothetical protein
VASRAGYIEAAKTKKFKVTGYYFNSYLSDAISRNGLRTGKERVKEVAIRATNKKLQPPAYSEGFDELMEVTILGGRFSISAIS